ncbi:Hypothetical predicted protein [Olea europaea subsp. europaea]|uniref:Uncharacterized protein n=1 Tax=Olea europaea subsp. europaea TaxID=158383 RepID=A0A8S0SX61_OLEEU|nr:Hypothetical predicted protein [Olea europaea subsp. europaea]
MTATAITITITATTSTEHSRQQSHHHLMTTYQHHNTPPSTPSQIQSHLYKTATNKTITAIADSQPPIAPSPHKHHHQHSNRHKSSPHKHHHSTGVFTEPNSAAHITIAASPTPSSS